MGRVGEDGRAKRQGRRRRRRRRPAVGCVSGSGRAMGTQEARDAASPRPGNGGRVEGMVWRRHARHTGPMGRRSASRNALAHTYTRTRGSRPGRRRGRRESQSSSDDGRLLVGTLARPSSQFFSLARLGAGSLADGRARYVPAHGGAVWNPPARGGWIASPPKDNKLTATLRHSSIFPALVHIPGARPYSRHSSIFPALVHIPGARPRLRQAPAAPPPTSLPWAQHASAGWVSGRGGGSYAATLPSARASHAVAAPPPSPECGSRWLRGLRRFFRRLRALDGVHGLAAVVGGDQQRGDHLGAVADPEVLGRRTRGSRSSRGQAAQRYFRIWGVALARFPRVVKATNGQTHPPMPATTLAMPACMNGQPWSAAGRVRWNGPAHQGPAPATGWLECCPLLSIWCVLRGLIWARRSGCGIGRLPYCSPPPAYGPRPRRPKPASGLVET